MLVTRRLMVQLTKAETEELSTHSLRSSLAAVPRKAAADHELRTTLPGADPGLVQ